jgi:DNA-binding transcriptional MocR family regulator
LQALPRIEAGLQIAGLLTNGMTSAEAVAAASAAGVEAIALDRFCLKRTGLHGMLLGFSAFRPVDIQKAVAKLGKRWTLEPRPECPAKGVHSHGQLSSKSMAPNVVTL